MTAPKWATDLANEVMSAEDCEPVAVSWRRSHSRRVIVYSADDWPRTRTVSGTSDGSSGHADTANHRIVLTAGKSRLDQKMVLLHELAHILTPAHHHDAMFWDKAWALYRRYGIPIRYAQKREYGYRKEARAAYARSIRRATT